MARREPAKIRFLHFARGRYTTRVTVPDNLRSIVGKRELLQPLGADRVVAIRKHYGHVDRFNAILEQARQGLPPTPPPLPKVPISHAAHDLYAREFALDDAARYGTIAANPDFDRHDETRPSHFNKTFANAYLERLRKLASGHVSDVDIAEGFVEAAVGWAIDIASEGKERPTPGTKAYLALAQALSAARIESIERSRERDDGDFKGQPQADILRKPPPPPASEAPTPVSLDSLFDDYEMTDVSRNRWRPVFQSLVHRL